MSTRSGEHPKQNPVESPECTDEYQRSNKMSGKPSENAEEEVADYQDDGDNYDDGDFTERGGEGVQAEDFNQSVAEMDEELEKLAKMQQQVEKQINSTSDKMDETSM